MPTEQEIQGRIDALINRRGIEKVSKSFLLHPYGGYTPAALNNLLFMHNKSREECADIMGVSFNTVSRWCVGLDSKRHTDMPLKLWEKLNEYLEENTMTGTELYAPAITEYFAVGAQVYAQYDDGFESFVLQADSIEHAEQKANALNSKLNA